MYPQDVDREACTYRGVDRAVYLQGVDIAEDPAHHVLKAILVHLLHGVALDAASRYEHPDNR